MMKKTLGLLMAAMIVLSGCGAKEAPAQAPEGAAQGTAEAPAASASVNPEEFKTIGDILNAGLNSPQYATYNNYLVYVFEAGDTVYRAIASVPDDTQQAIFDLDYADEDHDAKFADLVSPLAIDRLENLTLAIPPQDELDTYVGLTGQDLLDGGWTCQGYNLDTMEFYMNHGAYQFLVVMEGEAEMSDDYDAVLAPLTVKSISYYGLGDATDLESDDGQ